MKCYFLDERVDFFRLLGDKLGADIELIPFADTSRDTWSCCDVGIVGVSLSPETGIESLREAALNAAGVPIVAFLSTPDRQLMRDAIQAGAYDCFVETNSMEELRIVLRRAAQFHELGREVSRLRNSAVPEDFSSVIGTDPKMLDIFRFAGKIASTEASVLITGETGTGKELLAHAIHDASTRAQQPFVAVACSSLPETLIEAELFGHERGAFTGATNMRRGRFEAAERGTIFLDEIGELSATLQVKLLRVLQEHTFERLGSNQQRPMEARVICATHKDLKALVRAGQFRADLYYRLNTIEIVLPPLRERQNDVLALANLFLGRYADTYSRPVRRISPVANTTLRRYSWPGNVRELQHVIERGVLVCEGPELRLEHLPPELTAPLPNVVEVVSLEDEVKSVKRRLILWALKESGNNKVQAAQLLRISRSSLHRLIDELQINAPSAQSEDIALAFEKAVG